MCSVYIICKVNISISFINDADICRPDSLAYQLVFSRCLVLFERKVLRKIFDPSKERDGTWRIKTNDELYKLIRHKNIINYIKAQRLSWFGHLHRRENG
jgi:hypothetical protein